MVSITVCRGGGGGRVSLPMAFFLKFVLEVNVRTMFLPAVKILPAVIVASQFNCCLD